MSLPIGSSIWSSQMPLPASRFSGGTLRADFAVIGGGLTGLSTARHLLALHRGAKVVVLEAESLGAGASGRSSGMLSPGVGQSLLALVRRLGPDAASALYRRTLEAVQSVVKLVAEEGIECELEMTGQLHVAYTPASRRRLRKTAELYDRFHLPFVALDDKTLANRVRLLRLGSSPGDGPAALHLPVAGTLHPGRLLSGLADNVERLGGEILEGALVHRITGKRPVHLELEGGKVLADRVVVATAGYTPHLGILQGRILPLHLQILVTEPLSQESLAAIGWQGREGIVDARRIFDYFRLTRDNRILFGGGSPRYLWQGRSSGRSDENALELLLRRFATTFPEPPRVSCGWSGVIDYTLDALPTIRQLPDNDRVLIAAGFCGHGVALSVAAGMWIAQSLVDSEPRLSLFHTTPPLLPTEPIRWAGAKMAIGVMSLMDRFES